MKKISICSYAMLCAMIANAAPTKQGAFLTEANPKISTKPLLSSFESVKQQAISAPNEKADDVKGEWDKIVETLEGVISQVKTLKKANHVLLQHEAVATKAKNDLGKSLDGKTKSTVASYSTTASAGVDKVKGFRKGINDIAQNLQGRTETAMKALKDANANDTKAHNKTQGAIADLDAQRATEEPSKLSKENVMKKTEKAPKVVATPEEKQAKKDARKERKRKKIAQ